LELTGLKHGCSALASGGKVSIVAASHGLRDVVMVPGHANR